MRMTNKIMQNNSLYNINNNKLLQDKLSTQMSTQKKITRPSDDPVVAIRALRLRTNVSELTQYYEKNAPDAASWLSVTEKSLDTGVEVLKDMIKQATKAANKDLEPENLSIILQQMKNLRDEYYSTGNVDFAGRYVFTGFRTDTSLTFTSELEEKDAAGNPLVSYDYTAITQPVRIADFDTVNYTDMSKLSGLTKSNYNVAAYNNVEEQQITNGNIHRIRLAYDKLKGNSASGTDDVSIDYGTGTVTAKTMSINGSTDPYQSVLDGTESVVFIPETGEILFSDTAYANLNGNITANTDINITYGKDEWKNGDIRPEHYFKCTADVTKSGKTTTKVFNNAEDVNDQIIEYDVGYNQKIRVNTLATEAFTHGIDRDIDDLERALKELVEIDATLGEMKGLKKSLTEGSPDYLKVEKLQDAAQKAYDFVREKIHTMFENTITSMQGYLDDTSIAVTDNGTRSSRLQLISNRLMEQQTNFQTLQSENEDVDIADVAIKLTSTEMTYNAALMATGKIMQTSLMNYI